MHLVKANLDNIKNIMDWFPCGETLGKWSGPGFRFPFNECTFVEDIRFQELPSYCLLSDDDELLAFGQFYQRQGRCHLGRLVVNPKMRGEGIASNLLKLLSELGKKQLNLLECSLFVLADNVSAIKAYKKFGFVVSQYPEKIPIENCLYMIKKDCKL